MQTAPMENMLKQVKTQKNLKSNPGQAEQLKGALYSPLVNGVENSNNDNAHIMASDKGATPGQPAALKRQGSIGPAVCSEFNPLDADMRNDKAALDNPTIKKTEQSAGQAVLFDNFLNAQNALNIGTGGKLVSGQQHGSETNNKSIHSSPSGPGTMSLKQRTRQLTLANQVSTVNKKNRKLTCSASIPELQKPTSMTPQGCYLSLKKQQVDSRTNEANNGEEF